MNHQLSTIKQQVIEAIQSNEQDQKDFACRSVCNLLQVIEDLQRNNVLLVNENQVLKIATRNHKAA